MERGHAGHENRNSGGNEGDGARDQRHQKYVEKHDAEGKNGDSSHALVSNRMEQSGKAVVFHGVVPFKVFSTETTETIERTRMTENKSKRRKKCNLKNVKSPLKRKLKSSSPSIEIQSFWADSC